MRREVLLAAMLLPLSGCAGEAVTLAAIFMSMSAAAWLVGRGRQRQALHEAESIRRAITSGNHRGLEERLHQELALAEAGEAVSQERQWLARAQLGGLLVAEWRLSEAAEIYARADGPGMAPHLRALAAFGRHEVGVLTRTASQVQLDAIRSDRDECLDAVPVVFRRDVQKAWNALEGLCLVRMGEAREGARLLEDGIKALEYNPALVVYLYHLGQAYEHIGERTLAAERYGQAAKAFPGTRLASEAASRTKALGSGSEDGMFRNMLPETPAADPGTSLVKVDDEEPRS
jgi:tetratricopeptide (TPR) repeat protein